MEQRPANPIGLQVAFLEIRQDVEAATDTNGTQFLIGTIPKGAMVVAVYKKTNEAPTGGVRQLWIGTTAAKSSLIGAAGIAEGTSTTVLCPIPASSP